jgi:hypothetical protein
MWFAKTSLPVKSDVITTASSSCHAAGPGEQRGMVAATASQAEKNPNREWGEFGASAPGMLGRTRNRPGFGKEKNHGAGDRLVFRFKWWGDQCQNTRYLRA